MEANITNWQAAIGASGCGLRPHAKTHKSPAIARLQLKAGAIGLTVAKISEAEVFADAGCDDIFVAYPIIGEIKWRRAAQLARRISLTVGVDNVIGAKGLSAAAIEARSVVRVRVEVDIGLNRAGVSPEKLADLCRLTQSLPGLELDGIFAYRSVHHASGEKQDAHENGKAEGELMVSLANSLRADGIPIRAVSAGSTPTGRAVAQIAGITEVRPGTYVFGDDMLAQTGVMTREEIALSILCTVVSRPSETVATIDGGSKTFGGDIFPAKYGLNGYAREVGGESLIESLSEEHGLVRLVAGSTPGGNAPAIGDKIAFHPLHVCTTVNLADELIGVRDGKVECVFPVAARGKRT